MTNVSIVVVCSPDRRTYHFHFSQQPEQCADKIQNQLQQGQKFTVHSRWFDPKNTCNECPLQTTWAWYSNTANDKQLINLLPHIFNVLTYPTRRLVVHSSFCSGQVWNIILFSTPNNHKYDILFNTFYCLYTHTHHVWYDTKCSYKDSKFCAGPGVWAGGSQTGKRGNRPTHHAAIPATMLCEDRVRTELPGKPVWPTETSQARKIVESMK